MKEGYKDKFNLTNAAMNLFCNVMPQIEIGFCKQTTATIDKLAQASFSDKKTIRKALKILSGVLCEFIPGQPLKKAGIATRFRRYSIEELKSGKPFELLLSEHQESSLKLAEVLNKRKILFDGVLTPYNWSISRTGRVTSKIQTEKKNERIFKILPGRTEHGVLYYLDFKQAEPTVIQHAANYIFDEDPYQKLSKIERISREKAKEKLNSLHYIATSPLKIIEQWPQTSRTEFSGYANNLHVLRENFWTNRNQKPGRGVKTLSGHFLKARKGESIHKGQLLCWMAQGTIADIINISSLEIIKKEKTEGWQFLYPLHDAIFVIGDRSQGDKLISILQNTALSYGIHIKVDKKSYPVGGNFPRNN